MDESIKGRIRLWLKSERVLGLHSLRVRGADMLAPGEGRPQAAVGAEREQRGLVPSESEVDRAAPAVNAAALFASLQEMPFDAPVLPRQEKIRLLSAMEVQQVKQCTRCRLCEQRTQAVFGEGDPDAALCFIGEGPGENEDQTGRPFVGRAGQKLDEMITAMGLRREQVYIANVVKCRPPGNRAPAPDEVDACTPYLERQLEIIRPKVIVTLGLPATRYITRSELSMGRLRGQWHTWRGIKVMPTYHPAYILRNYTVATRKAVWSDLQKVMAELGLPPGKGKGSGNSE